MRLLRRVEKVERLALARLIETTLDLCTDEELDELFMLADRIESVKASTGLSLAGLLRDSQEAIEIDSLTGVIWNRVRQRARTSL